MRKDSDINDSKTLQIVTEGTGAVHVACFSLWSLSPCPQYHPDERKALIPGPLISSRVKALFGPFGCGKIQRLA